MSLLSKYINYSNFITFVENISVNKNDTLTESIITGFNIIMEGVFLDQYGSEFKKYTHNPSQEEIKDIASNPRELKKYFYGLLIKIIDTDYSNVDEAEHIFSQCVKYIADNPNILTGFDKYYGNLETYVKLFVYRNISHNQSETHELIEDDTSIADKSSEYEEETERQGGVLDSAIEWTADALATRMAKKADGSIDATKHEKLYDSYYKFLQNYVYTKDSNNSNNDIDNNSESLLEQKAVRDKLIAQQNKYYTNFIRSVGNIITSPDYNLKKIIGEDFNPEETLLKFRGMSATPPEGSKKIAANSKNIKNLLGDKLYNVIYSLPAQKNQIDKIDRTESELNALSHLRTKRTRIGAGVKNNNQNTDIDEKTGIALIRLLKKFHTGE